MQPFRSDTNQNVYIYTLTQTRTLYSSMDKSYCISVQIRFSILEHEKYWKAKEKSTRNDWTTAVVYERNKRTPVKRCVVRARKYPFFLHITTRCVTKPVNQKKQKSREIDGRKRKTREIHKKKEKRRKRFVRDNTAQ